MSGRGGWESKGRGSQAQPPSRFGGVRAEIDLEAFEHDEEALEDLRSVRTEFLPDASKVIVSENDRPDIPFRYSVSPIAAARVASPGQGAHTRS